MNKHSTLSRWWRDPTRISLVLGLITGCAALLRFLLLDTLPPGLYHDEAYNGLDALGVLDGHLPLFFQANNGREPLFIYSVALGIALWGRSPGAMRVVSALIGTLTIPALYWAGRELFNSRVGLLAAALTATMVWTLNLSRVAFRAGMMVPLLAVTLALLWRGLRYRRPGVMIWAGAAYGLSMYTYLAARFSVIALALFLLYTFAWHKKRCWFRGWIIFGLIVLLVAAPLLGYFFTHWINTMGRAGQVSVLNPAMNNGNLWATLVRHTGRTLAAVIYRGDFIPRHNVPYRPFFDPLAGLAFLAGVGLALARLRQNAAYGLALIWLGIMLLPTILAEGAPHMLRASGALPALLLFPALALDELWQWVARRSQELAGAPGGSPWSAPALVGAIVLLGAGQNVTAYAQHLRSEAVYYNFEAGATALAVDINRFLGTGWQGEGLFAHEQGAPDPMERRVYLARRLWNNWPSVRYLSPASDALVVLPQEGELPATDPSRKTMLVLWPFEDNSAAMRLLPQGQVISAQEGAQERGDLENESRLLYITLQAQPADGVPTNANAAWEQGIRLLGYAAEVTDERTLQVDLYWQAADPVEAGYTVFCHVVRDGQMIGQHDGPAAGGYYPTERWRAGDIVRDRHVIGLSAPYEAGRDELYVGLYRWENLEHLAPLDQAGLPTGETSVRLAP